MTEGYDFEEDFENAPSTPQPSIYLNTPQRKKGPKTFATPLSTRPLQSSTPLTAPAFKRKREELTAALFEEYADRFPSIRLFQSQ